MNKQPPTKDDLTVIESWEAYVDEFDVKTVHLVMVRQENGQDVTEFGQFPRNMFSRINLMQGLLLTVKILSNETITFETVKPKRSNDGEKSANLISVLSEDE